MTVTIEVHATPGARRNHVGGQHDGALRVSVTAPAEKGRANKAIQKMLADALGVSPSKIELSSGTTSRRKVFKVGETDESLASRIMELKCQK